LFDFKKYGMKITSKSPSRHLVRLQGKLKLAEKEKIKVFLSFYHIFSIFLSRPPSHQPNSVADLGKRKSRQTFDISVPAEYAF
jgi:hypothetical protein